MYDTFKENKKLILCHINNIEITKYILELIDNSKDIKFISFKEKKYVNQINPIFYLYTIEEEILEQELLIPLYNKFMDKLENDIKGVLFEKLDKEFTYMLFKNIFNIYITEQNIKLLLKK